MDKLKQMLDAYRNKDREFPTYDELAALVVAPVVDLDLRDRFAMAALPAVVQGSWEGKIVAKEGSTTEAVMAEQAYHFADAMLAARGAA